MKSGTRIIFDGILGFSANREVFLGFADAKLLKSHSFADILDEDTGRGYQRRFNPQHSQDFRRYIQREGSSTIPLTLNLRPCDNNEWQFIRLKAPYARLEISENAGRIFAQVDCQHRLGHLDDLSTTLPFMSFIGLTVREEMEVFNVINSKAKGLSTSLLDFHDAQLAADLATERPELFIALQVNTDPSSPWHRELDLGGISFSGLNRRASLRTMQKAVKRFLAKTKVRRKPSTEESTRIVLEFWAAVADVLHEQWREPRKHFITKGIGVYALMELAADLCNEAWERDRHPDKKHFVNALSDFAHEIDWSAQGPFKGFGGESGVKSAIELIREKRKRAMLKVVSNG